MKKVAVNTVRSYLSELEADNSIMQKYPVGNGGDEFEVSIKTNLTIEEKSVFIRRVLSGCFDARRNFRPEYVTPMIHATTIQMCTNLPVMTLRGDKSADGEALMDVDAMDTLYRALQFGAIRNENFKAMIQDIEKLVADALEWEKQRKLKEIGTESISEATDAVYDVAKKISGIVDNIDTKELLEYAMKLSNNTENLDTKGLISAILEAKGEDTDE